jgi:hypothetical protein
MAKSKLSIVATTETTTLDNASLARSIGASIGEMNALENKAAQIKAEANKSIQALHKNKVVVGTYRKDGTGCLVATAFVDGCTSKGISPSTAQKTYLPTFKAHVASGKEVVDWNSQRAKNKGTGGKAKAKKELADKLATCYRDAEFAEFIADLQASYDNDEGDLITCIESYLEMNGIKTKTAE